MTAAPFDPNHAPDGYVAVKQPSRQCIGCALHERTLIDECLPAACTAKDRPDRTTVIFIRRDSAPSGAQEDTQ